MTFTTKSGSVYEVDGLRVRRLFKGPASPYDVGRVASEWKTASKVEVKVGKPAVIYWGAGYDEFSGGLDAAMALSPDANSRFTVTSDVVEIH